MLLVGENWDLIIGYSNVVIIGDYEKSSLVWNGENES